MLTYLIVVLGPGRLIGPLGTRTLSALRIVGAIIVVNAVIATIAVTRRGGTLQTFLPGAPGTPEADLVVTVLDRTAAALPFIAGGAVAACVVWLAHRTLVDLSDVGVPGG